MEEYDWRSVYNSRDSVQSIKLTLRDTMFRRPESLSFHSFRDTVNPFSDELI